MGEGEGKSQGILFLVREIYKNNKMSGNFVEINYFETFFRAQKSH